MMCNRHQCHNPSLCVTCADHADRHQRHTPLEGVTIVTLVDKVPMPSFYCGGRGAGGDYAFALCGSLVKNEPTYQGDNDHRKDRKATESPARESIFPEAAFLSFAIKLHLRSNRCISDIIVACCNNQVSFTAKLMLTFLRLNHSAFFFTYLFRLSINKHPALFLTAHASAPRSNMTLSFA
jgi:hypothetical protein